MITIFYFYFCLPIVKVTLTTSYIWGSETVRDEPLVVWLSYTADILVLRTFPNTSFKFCGIFPKICGFSFPNKLLIGYSQIFTSFAPFNKEGFTFSDFHIIYMKFSSSSWWPWTLIWFWHFWYDRISYHQCRST